MTAIARWRRCAWATLTIGAGRCRWTIAPHAGGRIAQIRLEGVEQLVGYGDDTTRR